MLETSRQTARSAGARVFVPAMPVHPSLTVADDWPAILPPLARLDCPLGGLVAGLGVATASHCF